MNHKLVRPLSIAAILLCGMSSSHAETVLELTYPGGIPGSPCLFTTDAEGISDVSGSLNLKANGTFAFGTMCPQGSASTPAAPVIVSDPSNWSGLATPLTLGAGNITLKWAAPYADTCTVGYFSGSVTAADWPTVPTVNCAGGACNALRTETITPTQTGSHRFQLTCSNASSTPISIASSPVMVSSAAVVNPTIISGPGPGLQQPWAIAVPWTLGTPRTVNWRATGANRCDLSATDEFDNPRTMSDFSTGPLVCENAADCASTTRNSVTINPQSAGKYKFSLVCTSPSLGSATSTGPVLTVDSGVSTGCPVIPGQGSVNWARVQAANIFYANTSTTIGYVDVTEFRNVWGRDYSDPVAPIVSEWPGYRNVVATPQFGNGDYLGLKFTVPAGTSVIRNSQLTVDGTSFSMAGGGVGNNSKMSMTISKKCGDFSTTSADIPARCYRSQMSGNASFTAMSNFDDGVSCKLTAGETYYLNVIYAPLTTAASPTLIFNGGGGVVMIRNFATP